MRIFHTVFVLLAVLFFKSQFNVQGIKDPKQFIKFNSSPVFVGEYMPYYEYVINKKISTEIGVRFVTDKYLMNFVQESNSAQSRVKKLGPAFSLVAHYYPYRKGDLIYCSAAIKYRRYRKANEQYSVEGNIEESIENNQGIIPRIGLGYDFYLNQHFLIDLSANFGLTFEKEFKVSRNVLLSNYYLHFGLGLKLV